MLITVFYIFDPKITGKAPNNKVKSLSLAEPPVGFEPGPSDSYYNTFNPLGHSPQIEID